MIFLILETIHSFCKRQFSGLPVLDPRTDMLKFHTDWGTISANFSEEDANQKYLIIGHSEYMTKLGIC
jgi:hypothetical protein